MYVCIYVWLSAIKEEVELCENFEITYPGKAGTMQKRPSWKTNSSSSSQQIPFLLKNTKVRRQPCPLPLSWARSTHSKPTRKFFEINFIWSPQIFQVISSLRFPHQNSVCISPFPRTCHMPPPRLPQISWFNHPINIWHAVPVMSSSLCNLLQSAMKLIPLGPKCLPHHPIFEHVQWTDTSRISRRGVGELP